MTIDVDTPHDAPEQANPASLPDTDDATRNRSPLTKLAGVNCSRSSS